MGLNYRCSELRGVANPNQARYHFPFAVPRSSMTGREALGWKRLAEI